MHIYAIGDLHLAGSTSKSMDIFGEVWKNHPKKIEKNWRKKVSDEDIVLIPGDISWAMTLEQVREDLEWIGTLPGRKVIIKGNHDFWWSSISKVRSILPPRMYAIQNDSITFGDIAIAGTRLWEDPSLNFDEDIEWINRESIGLPPEKGRVYNDRKIFQRELNRLELSLQSVRSGVKKIIVMLHFPPTDFNFRSTKTTILLQSYGIDICVYGHLHSLKRNALPDFPVKRWGIDFYLVSGDFIQFDPVRIL